MVRLEGIHRISGLNEGVLDKAKPGKGVDLVRCHNEFEVDSDKLTRFSALEGDTQAGSESAASMRRNSPSESYILMRNEKTSIVVEFLRATTSIVGHIPHGNIESLREFPPKPYNAPLIIYTVSYSHSPLKFPAF